MAKETKLRVYSTTAKAALETGNEAWMLKKWDEQKIWSIKNDIKTPNTNY